MSKSEAFERNTALVADVVTAIPAGRCMTYGDIGEAVGIVPRYVALIMASADEIHATPWHRVVGKDATIKRGGHSGEQIRRLKDEGFHIVDAKILDFESRQWTPTRSRN